MNTIFKLACLAVYVAALAGAVWPFPGALWLQYLALGLLAIHALELAVALPVIRQQPGPLIDGIALTLLFGLLHWASLNKRPR